MNSNIPVPKFRFFDLVQSTKTGKFFVITSIKYAVQKTLLGEIQGYTYKYNESFNENDLVMVLTAPEAEQRGVLSGAKLLPGDKNGQ